MPTLKHIFTYSSCVGYKWTTYVSIIDKLKATVKQVKLGYQMEMKYIETLNIFKEHNLKWLVIMFQIELDLCFDF